MSTPGLIEIQANALALALLIQAQAKAKGESETEFVSYPRTHKEYLAQSIANMTRQDIWNMVDKRLEGGHLYRIDRLEKTVESYGVRIAQLEANQKPPQLN
jgi:hypothetical protein